MTTPRGPSAAASSSRSSASLGLPRIRMTAEDDKAVFSSLSLSSRQRREVAPTSSDKASSMSRPVGTAPFAVRRPSISTSANVCGLSGAEQSKKTSSQIITAGLWMKVGTSMAANDGARLRKTSSVQVRPTKNTLQDKNRERAEIYAINTFLRTLEQEKFEKFKAELTPLDSLDDITWCSDESSVIPSPQYRTEKEKRKTSASGAASRLHVVKIRPAARTPFSHGGV